MLWIIFVNCYACIDCENLIKYIFIYKKDSIPTIVCIAIIYKNRLTLCVFTKACTSAKFSKNIKNDFQFRNLEANIREIKKNKI